MRRWLRTPTGHVVTVVVALVVGLVAGVVLSALARGFVLDDPFWRAFLSGPPAAGLFAVIAACVAFFPAFRSTRIARENAAREQWWKRAEWALGMAGSDSEVDREVANDALIALFSEATQTEAAMVWRTISNLQDGGDVDTAPTTPEDGE